MASGLRQGDVVTFHFSIDSPIAGRAGERRSGIGTIYDNETNYSCWPPGRTVKMASSDHYKPGKLIAVATHNLRRISGSK